MCPDIWQIAVIAMLCGFIIGVTVALLVAYQSRDGG